MKVLFFYTNWCPPCKVVKPYIEAIESKTNAEVRRINVDEDPLQADKHCINRLPAILVYNTAGIEVYRTNSVLTINKLLELEYGERIR